jgi:hypothetical protein
LEHCKIGANLTVPLPKRTLQQEVRENKGEEEVSNVLLYNIVHKEVLTP